MVAGSSRRAVVAGTGTASETYIAPAVESNSLDESPASHTLLAKEEASVEQHSGQLQEPPSGKENGARFG